MDKLATKNKFEITLDGANKIRRLFEVGSEITELAEDVLDELGEYTDEFLQGIRKSIKEAKAGKLKKIKSLKDLR